MMIDGQTADEIWKDAFASIIQSRVQDSRRGQTQEKLHVMLHLHNPRERWVVSRFPMINPAFAFAEVIWILNGRQDSKFLNHWNQQLPEYAGQGQTYHGAYGHRLRYNFGFDQLERAYEVLRNEPDSRQVVLQIWDSNLDFPQIDGTPTAKDIPCNIQSMPSVRQGKLEWMQIMRSNDLMRGLPYNFIQFTVLQEVFAGWLGLEVGNYNHLSNSLHIYLSDSFSVETHIKPPPNTDDLRLDKKQSEDVFRELSGVLDWIISDVTEKQLMRELNSGRFPRPYKNILCLLIAEECRKRRWFESQASALASNTNPLYAFVWERWSSRFKRSQDIPA